jgi:hypothetical protein
MAQQAPAEKKMPSTVLVNVMRRALKVQGVVFHQRRAQSALLRRTHGSGVSIA